MTKNSKEPIFGVGDMVRVINYGHPIWVSKKESEAFECFPLISRGENGDWRDINPKIVGESGIIEKCESVQGIYKYAISGIPGKHAWYDEKQLKMANKNPNR